MIFFLQKVGMHTPNLNKTFSRRETGGCELIQSYAQPDPLLVCPLHRPVPLPSSPGSQQHLFPIHSCCRTSLLSRSLSQEILRKNGELRSQSLVPNICGGLVPRR